MLPAAWARDELLLDERDRWRPVEWAADGAALRVDLGAVDPAGAPDRSRRELVLVALGPTSRVVALATAALDRPARSYARAWVATEALPALRDRLARAGLHPNRTGWEWMVLHGGPLADPAPHRLRALDGTDRREVLGCLAVANPATEAVPLAPGERWWGVRGADGTLRGVIGAEPRPGDPDGAGSWHLHGLGVRPDARGQGIGAALVAGAAARLHADGADWVSLGMWDDNDGARRIYHRLGFRTVHRMVTLHRR